MVKCVEMHNDYNKTFIYYHWTLTPSSSSSLVDSAVYEISKQK